MRAASGLRSVIFVFVLLFSTGASLSAFAQQGDKQAMLELNEQGFEAFSEGRFSRAARLFSRGYEEYPDPTLLKNEAIAWYKAGAWAKSISAANKFLLKEETDAADEEEVHAVLANAKVELAREALDGGSIAMASQLLDEVDELEPDQHVRDQASALRVRLAKLEQEREPEETDEPDETDETDDEDGDTELASADEGDAESTDDAEAGTGVEDPDVTDETTPEKKGRGVGWALVGTGGAMVAAAIVYHVLALGWQGEFLDMAENGGDEERFEMLRNRVHTARWAVPVLYGVGAVTTGIGIAIAVRPAGETPPEEGGEEAGPSVRVGFTLRW